MCNSIFIDKKTMPDAEDGEEVEVMVKGIYRTEDGVRKVDVVSADGRAVVGPDEGDCGCEDHEDMMNQDGDDALRIFLIKKRKE